ncbi:MAG: DUF4126 domain-containing protein [Caldilineaceae bacterium]
MGFRIFVPFTVMSVAALTGNLQLTPGFAWIGTWPALILFATATVLEIGAYYIPWLDNALDTVATPARSLPAPWSQPRWWATFRPCCAGCWPSSRAAAWAEAVQTGTTLLRVGSTATTGGVGNPVINTAEIASSFSLSVVTVVLPLLALAAVITLIGWGVRRLTQRRRPANAVPPG